MTNLTNRQAIETLGNIFGEEPTPEEKPQVAPPSDPRLPGYDVLGVLAGAYKGKRTNLKTLRTHYALVGQPLCNTVKADSLADVCSDDLVSVPTCPSCLARARKIAKGG